MWTVMKKPEEQMCGGGKILKITKNMISRSGELTLFTRLLRPSSSYDVYEPHLFLAMSSDR